jgi:hypothetical protein
MKAAVAAVILLVVARGSVRCDRGGAGRDRWLPPRIRGSGLAGHAEVTGRRTMVLEKLAGGWKIVHLHASNVSRPPAQEPAAPKK